MKNELLQLGLQLNVTCLEQLKLIVILTPNRPRWDSKPVRKIRISSYTAYPLHQTTTCSRKGMCLKSIFWEHGKAMGPGGIPVKVWKSLGEEGVDMLLDLLQKIFEQEKMPEEWRDNVIVPIFKEKRDIQDCGTYTGINMIYHTMKIWERIIDRRLMEETSIGEEQFGFMPGN